jgi:hypothetical protein
MTETTKPVSSSFRRPKPALLLAAEVSAKIPMIKTLHALGQTSDVMVCREQTNIASAMNLKEMLHLCHEAYVELSARPSTSPHSRFDILEWMPLDL